jgi:acylphosphatase
MTDQKSDKARVRVRISGRVQGVFFRAAAVAEARKLQVHGWVRNRPDGSVELLAEGPRASLDRLISWCGLGPPGAQVSRVQPEWEAFQGEFRDFRVTG